MNLTDLQVELRNIEEHIVTLHNEIEKMKPKTEEEKKADFDQITKLAGENPIVNKSIRSASDESKKLMFSSLAYILLLEETDFYNRILYLCRLAKGCDFNTSAEDLYKMGLGFVTSDLSRLSNDIGAYKYTYLVELLIVANLSEDASVNILSMIADIARMFEISKEEIRVLGMVAKGVLINDENYVIGMPIPSKNMWSGKLREYLSEEWIEKHRKCCEVLCTKKYEKLVTLFYTTGQNDVNYTKVNPCKIKNSLQAGTVVKKGDVICTYSERTLKKEALIAHTIPSIFGVKPEYVRVEKKVIAPCDGVVFFIEDKKVGAIKDKTDEYIVVFVVSYFDDYTNFCTWYKSIGNV
jgi:hypothetical protein